MSELTTASINSRKVRLSLLTTASAAALICASGASAADHHPDRPTVWIELGAQLERISAASDTFVPSFITGNTDSPAFAPQSPLATQRSPRYSKGLEGKVMFQPQDSDWLFSASLLYGRANGSKRVHQQTAGIHPPPSAAVYGYAAFETLAVKNFSDTRAKHSESHAVLDFQVGKDVGLGIFGRSGTSTINAGVRFAQFSSRTDVELKARPWIGFHTTSIPIGSGNYFTFPGIKYWHTYGANLHKTASFHGIGPSLSWNSSANLAGSDGDGELTFDWGLNAALLFGRQKTQLDHAESGNVIHALFGTYSSLYKNEKTVTRSRSVTVPNIGGFASLSVRYSAAKFSFGYRGDFFFGAMDTGIDSRHTTHRSFHGPFATISVGLGG
jgi:hypothetical protein